MKKFLQTLAILTLIVWGGMFLYFYASGRIEAHLDKSFRVYALVAGIGMLLLGAFNFLNRHRDTCAHDHDHDHAHDHDHHHEHRSEIINPEGDHAHDHDHSHSHDHAHDPHHDHAHDHHHHDHSHSHDHDEETASGLAFAIIVLLGPLLMATGYSKDKFSSEYLMKWGKIERQMMQMRIAKDRAAVSPTLAGVNTEDNPYTRNGIEGEGPTEADTPPSPDGDQPAPTEAEEPADDWGTFTMEDLKNMVPQNTDGDFLLDVPQIFYTAGDRELMAVMEDIPVETTAQLMEETMHNPDGNRLKAFRLFIECCAADARPLSIPVEFPDGLPDYTEMGWYKLFGNLRYVDEDESILPILKINRIEKTAEPMDGLLF